MGERCGKGGKVATLYIIGSTPSVRGHVLGLNFIVGEEVVVFFGLVAAEEVPGVLEPVPVDVKAGGVAWAAAVVPNRKKTRTETRQDDTPG